MFPYSLGVIIEELAENVIYIVALIYLWQFRLTDFESRLANKPDFDVTRNK
ncbi:hypothetical protein [Psychrobacter sp. 72-O-c]|uniref:hypothetical protein n=1 Tax=Psychrobacter sp. 72-O-c TaxID=2774125 RepID=UPI001D0F5D83|nr:hypothetical protein [Psychrobacter sp. 72-O-c]